MYLSQVPLNFTIAHNTIYKENCLYFLNNFVLVFGAQPTNIFSLIQKYRTATFFLVL
jgi:hypothetical protein